MDKEEKRKPTLLYIGDSYIPTETGFGRVTKNMIKPLLKDFDVHLFGINYYNNEHNEPFPIYPASGPNLEHLKSTPYGNEEMLLEVFKKVRPEIILANNDSWVVNKYYKILEPYVQSGVVKFFGYFPVDGGPYHWSLVNDMYAWTGIATYTEFGKKVLTQAGLPKERIKVVNHGTNKENFYPIDKSKARRHLGIRDDIFMVFNGNRNQHRKRYDLMVKGFAKFLKGKERNAIGLFAHGGLKPNMGWNVPALLEREMQRNGVDTTQKILYQYSDKPYPHNHVPVETLNLIYNAMDVGINTCMGEGWGLVNTEHAITGVPQVVPNHTSLAELFGDGRGFLIPVSYWETERPYLIERGVVDPQQVANILNQVYNNYELAKERGQKAQEFFDREELTWEYVAEDMCKWVKSHL